ncbi:penicillin-binding protein 1C [Legionella micdadei]|uniref:peptidoglycan glycosyltransferase n=1 Tax=Legionella micdadei TaxID=451 RepID=A0A098GFV6_LEGMI|nr:penicillin-binding protein 1C [Legionella micdadei]ARG97563.1 penicillin-binding protein 1C [Legionella micdadei]ARH00124.1 penicillin-binding protein 1C [Legionella micdadei]KTD27642.1 penicillin binding protein 1C [Legionella micdadei]NSL17625.1 penicillin-binding protein 1C [Legionella micdadei]CEG60872.1 Penicillin binding protein 1C [Legionella micdadei]
MIRFLKFFGFTFILLGIITWGILFFAPKPSLFDDYRFSTAVYDEQQHLLRLTLSQDEKYRLFTPLFQISPELKEATLLQEDQYFYWHYGVNPFAMLKACWQTYVVKSRRIGASTITMQLARIRFGINSKQLSGKLLQVFRALQLEMHYSKDKILEAYLNLAPYGNNIEGVGAASLIYFGKPVNKISLPEALTLSIIPQNPAQRIPSNTKLKEIRNKLFTRWLVQHPEDKNKASVINLPLEMLTLRSLPFIAPHFVNAVLRDTTKQQQITTTLDSRLQAILKRVTTHYLARKKSIGVYNAAVLLVDTRDMSVKGAVGSADFFNQQIGGQINGTDIKRSPGSTLKPFIYGLAIDQGLIHPNTVLKDVPHSFGSYNPENFDYDFMGPIKAKDALVLSRNIPAIYLESQLTKPNLYQLLEEAQVSQLKSESFYGLALSLGGVELTMKELASLYAILVNDGVWHPLRTRKDEPMNPGKRLLSPEASFLVLDMLKHTPRPEAHGSTINSSVSWKTGTSSGYRDAWSVGVFGPYVLTVWLGNFDNKANPAFVGKNLAAPLFFELVDAVRHERGPLPSIEKRPETMHLTHVEVCKASGMLPTRYCQDREMTWFIPGKSPIKTDTIFREVAINKNTGLRTCHFNETTHFVVYEFWPSDLLKIFKQAGIQRRVPPLFEPNCSLTQNTVGLSPQITSPQTDLSYIMRANAPQKMEIPLTAVTDADVAEIYWFINEGYLAKTRPDEPFLWKAKPGKFILRVVDDRGRSDARDINIQVDR